MPAPRIPLTVYTAHGCCLCDDARDVLGRLAPELGLDVEWVHIDGDPALEAAYLGNDKVRSEPQRKMA